MFDLPVKTACQRREANGFRNLLKDLGYCMVQLSVYIKYVPVSGGNGARVNEIRSALPKDGQVQVTFLSDRQWSKAKRFVQQKSEVTESAPQQLMIF